MSPFGRVRALSHASFTFRRAQFIANLGLGLIYCQIRNISFLFTIIHLARYAHSCTRKNTTQMYIYIMLRVSRAFMDVRRMEFHRTACYSYIFTRHTLPASIFISLGVLKNYSKFGHVLMQSSSPWWIAQGKLSDCFKRNQKPADFVFWKYYFGKYEWFILRNLYPGSLRTINKYKAFFWYLLHNY